MGKEIISFRVSEKEKKQILAKAKNHKMTVSQYCINKIFDVEPSFIDKLRSLFK
jgi:hypothetical protein